MNKLTKIMVYHLNLHLQAEGTCLRYVQGFKDGSTIAYDLVAVDKYIDTEHRNNVAITVEFENMVRMFFKGYNVEKTGFSNTVATIFAEE